MNAWLIIWFREAGEKLTFIERFACAEWRIMTQTIEAGNLGPSTVEVCMNIR
jgi:hypothetical protein